MRNTEVAVATITWARTAAEEALLGTSLEALAELGLPVAVANRGGSAAFHSRLRSLPGIQVCTPTERGLVPQVQASMATAATFGRRFVLYTEPDKHFFFRERLRGFLEASPDDDGLGVTIAGRSVDSFSTFPPTQRFTEAVINRLCGDMVGMAGDYSYGPFLVNAALLTTISAVKQQIGWGWRHALFVAAARGGFRVVHITGDYPCPPDQRIEDAAERTHRMRQLSENIRGLLA